MPDLTTPSSFVGSMQSRRNLWQWDVGYSAPAWMTARVMTGNSAPVPLSMVHPAFRVFAQALAAEEGELSPAAVRAAEALVDVVDAFFASDDVREVTYNDAFIGALRDLFPTMARVAVGTATTDGTVFAAPFYLPTVLMGIKLTEDPTAQNEAYYLKFVTSAVRAVRIVNRRLTMHPEVAAKLRAAPSFMLNIHNGSVLEVRGAALAGAGMISEPLAVATLRGIRGGPGVRALARLLHALVSGVATLTAAHEALVYSEHCSFVAVPAPSLASLLHPLELEGGLRVKCTRDLSPDTARLAFEATVLGAAAAVAAGGAGVAAGGGAAPRLAIKLARDRYGAAAHEWAAAAGYAPALRSVTALPNNLWAVAMDLLDVREGAWHPYNALTATAATKAAVVQAYLVAFTHNGEEYVHGDLRYGNVYIRVAATGHVLGVKFLDFDWAGRAGEVRYPPGLNTAVWRAAGLPDAVPGAIIPRAHDLHWLEGRFAAPVVGAVA